MTDVVCLPLTVSEVIPFSVFVCYCLEAEGYFFDQAGGRHSQGIPGTFPSCIRHLSLFILPNALLGRLDNI